MTNRLNWRIWGEVKKRILGRCTGSHTQRPDIIIGLACGVCALCDTCWDEVSLFVYAGSAQFAMLALIGGTSNAAIAMTVFDQLATPFCWYMTISSHTSLWQKYPYQSPLEMRPMLMSSPSTEQGQILCGCTGISTGCLDLWDSCRDWVSFFKSGSLDWALPLLGCLSGFLPRNFRLCKDGF